MSFFHRFYHVPLIEKTFKTTVYQLKDALNNCDSVLDLGCGPDSPLRYCENIDYSVGVELYEPYLENTKSLKIHDKYIEKDINKLNFEEDSFDAVIGLEVLEHIEKDKGLILIENAKKWAKKKVVFSTPNGYVIQNAKHGNDYQRHLSGWDIEELRDLGFSVKGLSGIKNIRTVNEIDEDNSKLEFKYPFEHFWYMIAILTQLYTYRYPKNAFELFCTYDVNHDK